MSGRGDWTDDPEAQAWLKRVDRDLVPRLQDSAATVSIVPQGETDLKFAVELGLSIMLDKPILLAVTPGTRIPDHLARVADDIVELDIQNPAAAVHFADQVQMFMKRFS